MVHNVPLKWSIMSLFFAARRMAERDILEKMMHESQKDGANRPTFVISNVTEVLEIPPRVILHFSILFNTHTHTDIQA